MKHKYNLTDTGKIIERLSHDTIMKERRKLKKYKKFLDNHKMSYHDIENSYKSWKGNNESINSCKTIKSMDKTFNELFIDTT